MNNLDIIMNLNSISHGFGKKNVLNDINLKINRGQIVALVGPSGCGKSTLFRSIVGTHPPEKGEVIVDNKIVNNPTRDVGIVYQHYSLMPFLTAKENVAFGLKLDQTGYKYRIFNFLSWMKLRKQHLKQSEDILRKLHLEVAINCYPTELSGGMRQRVAIAQALVMKPKLLLLDEPFGALDESTRESLQNMLLELYQENIIAKREGLPCPYTIVIITHELNEAIYVADRVVGLSQYWYKNEQDCGKNLGATVVYDKTCPVFKPNSMKEFYMFAEQKEELRKIVFNQNSKVNPDEHQTYWDSVQKGEGTGVLSDEFTRN